VLPGIAERTGASVNVIPCLLGGIFKATNNRSPVEAFGEVKGKLAYEALETRRFVAKHGLSRYRQNPHFPVNTLKIMRGACAAQQLGCFAPYVEAVYAAMWERGRNLAEDTEILATLQAAGLDGPALLAATQHADVKAALMANTQRSHERGAFGSPTFFVGDEIFFGKDRLRDVEEEIVRQQTQ